MLNTNEYAHTINGTMNLGKIFSWSHKIRKGLIVQRHYDEAVSNVDDEQLQDCLEPVIFPNVTGLYKNSNKNANKNATTHIHSRKIYRGINDMSDSVLATQLFHLTIDGWPTFSANNPQHE